MILDYLDRASTYKGLDEPFQKAFAWLRQTDLGTLPKGRYDIEGDRVFAMVNEYETVDPQGQKMESHRVHIDLQYMARGTELVGHDFLRAQQPSKAYDPDTDFMLYDENPSFFSRFEEGMFAIFYPEDLHMPNIHPGEPGWVKKVVVKIKV
ncbi:YhcH/YjgK/YiaL family protein [Dinghuibacter silviterrae]|uniref:YhcH/YjgK/YiaL family protein n=1 Tax=Dinghuibacter silviterrae TaxID=1539049 RepID=A0A4R8DV98_9BACT|nr:YhcH/YjgK/YiaL family protein [Dinghuibacter silviterrae]TDX01337.1 YhcH/YjgK/YiaL family protein [Dinghuibacter silviterrae]